MLPNLLHGPRAPFSRATSFLGTCRPNKEGVLNGPISKARKCNQAKGQRTLEPSSRQRKYIALPIISSVEHANPKQVKGRQQNNGPRASNPKQVIISGRRRGSTRSALRYSASLCSPRPVQRLCSPRPARRCAACHGAKRRDVKSPASRREAPRPASHYIYMEASQAWKAQRLPAPGAPRLHAGKGAKRPNPS